MILMGDEVRRTQHGNNNAYCHDNELNWFDWTLVTKHADVHRFVTLLNERRLLRNVEHERQRLTSRSTDPAGQQILARGEARTAGLEPSISQRGIECGNEAGTGLDLSDLERLLGAAGFRAAAVQQWRHHGAGGSIRGCSHRSILFLGTVQLHFRDHLSGAPSLRCCAVGRPERNVSVIGDPSAGRVAVDREMPAHVLTEE